MPMHRHDNVLLSWMAGLAPTRRRALLEESPGAQSGLPMEATISRLAATLLGACAADHGLTTMELASLLRQPRRDSLAGLVTLLRDAH